MAAAILVVEDDSTTRLSFVYRLQYAGYNVTEAPDGETALILMERQAFDVVITDIIMGQVDGMEVLHMARQQPYLPEVIILTGHGSFDTAVQAVREGACDYLVKPCSTEQLLTCVAQAVARHQADQQVRDAARQLMHALYGTTGNETSRSPQNQADTNPSSISTQTPACITIGALSLGATRSDVTFHGHPIRLTPIEYSLLRYLAERAGQICSSSDIVQSTHQISMDETEAQALVKPHIHNLRKKLAPDYLITKRGIGYRLNAPEE